MSQSTDRVLGIFVKQPIVGQAKTRLAHGSSAEFALRFAEAALRDCLDRFEVIDAGRVIAFTPAEAEGYFRRTAYELFPQGEGDLGTRLHRFFVAHQHPARKVVIVGTDSPTVPIEFLERAFLALDSNDVVLGPTTDGGYYLLGSKVGAANLFLDIPWSTSRVLEATVARVTGARLALLPPWYDVDTVDDWAMLRGHVQAMRMANIDPGVPNIERLIREQAT